jgi:thiamine pyrophosphokinase
MKVAIFSGGTFDNAQILPYDVLICADKGYEYALKLNLTPNFVVGDFDSLGYVPSNAEVVSAVKDFSDTEMAVNKAILMGASEIDVYFALGGRMDHALFNIETLFYASRKGIKAQIISQKEKIIALTQTNATAVIKTCEGKTVSVVPFLETSHIIDSKGLKYSLNNVTVKKCSTLTLSNVAISNEVAVTLGSGEVMLIFEL